MIIIKIHKNYLILIPCIAFLICCGCTSNTSKSSKVSNTYNQNQNVECNELNEKLIGKWEWQQTSGGFANKTSTPKNAGYTKQLVFNKNNTYVIYMNGKFESQGSYQIIKKKVITNGEAFVIHYNNRVDEIMVLTNNNLKLTQDVYDGFTDNYKKIN